MAALIPQLPLVVLPLPNITIYYSVWRIVSHYNATQGAQHLKDAMDTVAVLQQYRMAQQLVALQSQGVVLTAGAWPKQLVDDMER